MFRLSKQEFLALGIHETAWSGRVDVGLRLLFNLGRLLGALFMLLGVDILRKSSLAIHVTVGVVERFLLLLFDSRTIFVLYGLVQCVVGTSALAADLG